MFTPDPLSSLVTPVQIDSSEDLQVSYHPFHQPGERSPTMPSAEAEGLVEDKDLFPAFVQYRLGISSEACSADGCLSVLRCTRCRSH